MKTSTSLEHGIRMAHISAYDSACLMKLAGFDGVDLSMDAHSTEPELIAQSAWREKIVAQASDLKRAGLELAQCHLPYYPGHIALPGDGTWQAFEDFMLPSYIRALDVCGEIGCPVAVLHPFFDEKSATITLEGNLRMTEKMLPLLEKHHVKLALENVYGLNYADSHVARAEDIMPIIEKIDHPLVGACIDTGHANIFRLDISEMARIYGKKLFALHVNGNAGKDEHIIPYTSSGWCEKMDYHAFTRTLCEIGYDGYYNLEIASGDLGAEVALPFYIYAAAVARSLSKG